ncbi:hypothetical protein AS189_17715 [Arthrobacter alpinus]|uniref:Uncharacterized protein n=1 Tax=Arthrobacter alpinus TaxID=656366 RepID=A0A0S2M2I3_9MICC|nr:hypothetical protein [Arthrobacter alpinus]ALO67987.1 hypothetical protein AS189_17715 [Arthrobacter alpinus]
MSPRTSVTSRPRQAGQIGSRPNQPGKSQSTGIPVLPAVDFHRSAVTFQTPTGHHTYGTKEPEQLATALTQAVRPARWIPELGTLVVTVAQTGVRAGRNVGFRLFAY